MPGFSGRALGILAESGGSWSGNGLVVDSDGESEPVSDGVATEYVI